MRNETAADIVARHLLDVLPKGVPPSHREIVSARLVGSGRSRTAVAELIMFDGAHATVEVFSWGHQGPVRHGHVPSSVKQYGHRWLVWNGPAACFENGQWKRDLITEPV
jgi:hypothetical protein